MCARPSKEVRINGVDLEEWIFPFDQPISVVPAAFGTSIKMTDSWAAMTAEGAFLIFDGTLFSL